MSFGFPRPQTPVAEGGALPMSRSWVQWFRSFWGLLGFSPAVPVFGELYMSAAAALHDAGVTTTTVSNTTVPAMPASTDNAVHFAFKLPNSYRNSSDIKPFVEWAPTTTGSGDVRWLLAYNVASPGSVFPSSTVQTLDDAASETQHQLQQKRFTDISGTSLVRGDVLLVSIVREGSSAADTYAASAALVGAGIKFRLEGIGTAKAYP